MTSIECLLYIMEKFSENKCKPLHFFRNMLESILKDSEA